MAISDIPPFVPASPDDLIRSDDINNVQRLARAAARAHRHTRVLGAPTNDAGTQDLALQIGTTDIADLAVTANKLAGGAVVNATKIADGAIAVVGRLPDLSISTNKLQDASVAANKIAANGVARTHIQDGAINRTKLSLVEVASGVQAVPPPGGVPNTALLLLRSSVPDTTSILFWPQLTISSTGAGAAGQAGLVDATIVYRRFQGVTYGPPVVDVLLRLTNTGQVTAVVNWRVMTFAPFNPPAQIHPAIGGDLV
jgi:hypothetical protein